MASKTHKEIRDHLPLLKLLYDLSEDNRLIILDKLNPTSQRVLEKCIKIFFLDQHSAQKLKLKLKLNKSGENAIKCLQCKTTPYAQRKKALIHIGGGALSAILATVIPMLITELLPKS